MISARCPDLVYVDKKKKRTYLIDIASVMHSNVIDKKKIDEYLNLMIELQRLWDTKIAIVSHIFGALGSISDALNSYSSLLQITDVRVHQLLKTVLLKTATILQRNLTL